MLGQALDEALGDRAGIRRYGSALVPMDESLAECAIDISGRPLCAFDADLPATSIAGFDTELAEEFFRAVANSAKLTLHVTVRCGTNAHHMIEACFKAFARALREAVDDRPRARPACPAPRERLDRLTADRDPRLRHGQPALGREGARAGRGRGRDHQRPRGGARGRRASSCPGVGAFPKAMERIRELGLDELVDERVEAGRPGARHLPRAAAAVRLLDRARGRDGARAARGRGRPSSPPAASRSRTSAGRRSSWEHDLAAHRRDRSDEHALLLRPLVRAAARGPTTCSGPPPTASASPARSSATTSSASSSTPRSRAPRAWRCSRTSPASAPPHARRGVILYPAIDIRGGRAVRLTQGDYDARDRATTTTRSTRRARWAGEGAPLPPRRRPRRRPGRSDRANLEPVRRIAAAVECPIQVGGGLRDAARSRPRSTPGPSAS